MTMLNDLIIEGQEIRSGIVFVPTKQNEWRTFKVYRFTDNQKFEIWKSKCLRFLSKEFNGDRSITDFEESLKEMTKSNYPETLDKLIGVLEACNSISRIEKDIIAEKDSPSPAVYITNTQYQTQSQEIAINIFLEAIKDELTGKQLREIKEISGETGNSGETKNKLLNKLKSFGEDILSNIVANIITNPGIWSQF